LDDCRRLVAPDVEAEPGDPLDGDEVQEQGRDDLVHMPMRASQRGHEDPERARDRSREGHDDQLDVARTTPVDTDPRRRPGAHEELSLGADVPDLHAQRDVDRQRVHQDRCEEHAQLL
jgi:hypothetical protein